MQGMQVRNNGGVIYPLKCTESTQPCAASILMLLLLTDTLMMIHRTECMNVYRKMRRNYIYIYGVWKRGPWRQTTIMVTALSSPSSRP
jgi:hypothetical protein